MDAQALGRYPRQSREARELTLEDAERALKIRQRILESFELGDFTFPDSSSVQIRGFMRNYARYLGLDEDLVLQYYDAVLQGGDARGSLFSLSGRVKPKRARSANGANGARGIRDSQTAQAVPVAPRTITDTQPKLPAVTLVPRADRRSPALSLFNFLVRALVALAALSVIVFVGVQLIQPSTTTPEDDAPGILQLPTVPTFTLPPPTVEIILTATPTPLVVQELFTGQGVLVTIQTIQRTWLSVSADGVEVFAGLATPGWQQEFPASGQVSVRASNAEALAIVFNGEEQPTFGARGQLVNLDFRPGGVEVRTGPGFEPTPLASPTPLPTPTDPAGQIIAQLTPTVATETTAEALPPAEGTAPLDVQPSASTPMPTAIVPTDASLPTPDAAEAQSVPTSLPAAEAPTPTLLPTPTDTPLPTNTLPPTATITPLPTLTWTNTPIPSPSAILPPRITPANATPTKEGA